MFPWARCAVALAVLPVAAPALGGDYSLRLGVDQYFEYTDNVDLTSDDEIDATSYTLAPGLGLDGRGERWQLGLDLRTPFERYSESRLNSDNQDFDATFLRILEKGTFGVDARLLRNSTHTIDEAGTIERVANRRVLEQLTAYWTRRVGQRHEIKLSGSGQQVRYDSSLTCTEVPVPFSVCTGSPTLNDYEYGATQVDWTRLMSERTSTVVSLSWAHFTAELPPSREFPGFVPIQLPDRSSETFGLQGGLTRVFSEKMNGRFMVGARHTESQTPFLNRVCFQDPFNPGAFLCIPTDLAEDTSSDTSGQAVAGITYHGDRLDLDVSYTHTLVPSGRAALLNSDALAMELAYQLRERLELRVSASAEQNDSSETLLIVPATATSPDQFFVSKLDRKYYRLRPHLRWHFAQHWFLDSGVEYRSHDILNFVNPQTALPVDFPASNDASATSVFLTLTYNAEPISVFR